MDQNYGLYIIIGIGFIFFMGTGALILDCFIKPKTLPVIKSVKKQQVKSYYYTAPTESLDADYNNSVILEDDNPFAISSSSIFVNLSTTEDSLI